jgi:DNA-binding winged helix-turn-helix (wHTH) protein
MRFGEFVLDLDCRQLFRGGIELHVSPKAFDLLQILITERPKAISKTILQERLWPATYVAEANLPNLIGEIRSVLDDDPQQPRFIRTVHRFGYAFSGSVVAADEQARGTFSGLAFALTRGRRQWPLTDGENILGREGDGAVWFDSTTVSRRHARIVINAGEVIVEDLDSKNGTFVGGVRLTGPVRLNDGDELRLGSLAMIFRVSSISAQTETVATHE